MPELPEIETIRRGIESHLVGETVVRVIVRNGNLRWLVSKEIYTLNGKCILSVRRRAKYLLLEMSDGWVMIHLGMSGSLRILTEELLSGRHDHIDLNISNGKILRYTDPRRFGSWLWVENLEEHSLLKKLGPEPLSRAFNANYLRTQCKGKRIPIKSCLMNNHLVVGLGNIYTNESLFMAKINPSRLALSISKEENEFLVGSIKKVLQHSIEYGGTTLKDFLQINGNPGNFTQNLLVYGRKDKPCYICNTLISTIKHSQRTTFYCGNCQK